MATMYSPRHSANSMPRVQPFAGNNTRNLQPQQFGSGTGTRSSGNVNTGFNPLTYQGGAHRAGPGGMFNM
jgi:hypothetical protein